METNNSQEFQDYFNEILIIKENKNLDEYNDDDTSKATDSDANFEAEWLRNAGFGSLVSDIEAGEDVDEEGFGDFFRSLTRQQAAVVKKRIRSFKTTLRKKKISRQRFPDVREVFPQHSESSSGGTRSRSATPDSLDSLSPSQTPPSLTEWIPSEVDGSPNPSQGYHSHARSSPDPLMGFTGSQKFVRQNSKVDRRLSNPLWLERSESPDHAVSCPEREPNFVRIFRAPSSVDDREDSGQMNDSRHHQQYPSAHHERSRPTGQHHIPPEVPFRRPKNVYHFSSTGTLGSDTGIEILDYHNKGTIYSNRGLHPVSVHIAPPLSESRISIDLGVFSQGDSKQNFEWGFEKRNGINTADDDLPEIVQVSDSLGVTRIEDLGEQDLNKIKSLAHIELTDLFDSNKLQYSPRKPTKKKKDTDHRIFGAPLTTLLEMDRKIDPDSKVPLPLRKILSHLEKHGLAEEGILRIPGVVGKIQHLRQEFESHFYSSPGLVDKALRNCSVNDVAGLVKMFLRELPVPLLTNKYIDAFFQVDNLPELSDQLKALKLLMIGLPEAHRDTLKALLDFLGAVVREESRNRMNLQNVSMIIAPNLMIPRKLRKHAERDLSAEINMAAATCRITKMVIKYRDILWTVPSFLVKQIRIQNENAKYRQANKGNNKQGKKRGRNNKKTDIYRKITNEVDFQEGIIRVQAPQFGQQYAAVKLEEHTSAYEVVSRFIGGHLQCDNRSKCKKDAWARSLSEMYPNGNSACLELAADPATARTSHALYEVGGNIREHCLDSNANMIAVYQQNPNAEWEIRCKHRTNQPFVKEVVLI